MLIVIYNNSNNTVR